MFYSNIVYILIIVFLFYKLIKQDMNLFGIYVFTLPFQSWYYDIGLTLYAFQFIILLMIFKVFLPLKNSSQNLLYFGSYFILLYLLYIVVDSIVMSNFIIENYLRVPGYFRSEGRYISQLIFLILMFSIVPLAFNYIKSIQDAFKYFKIYLYALILLSILGWIQYSIYTVSGIDLFPIGEREGISITGIWDGIFRISSLGGDPKAFSVSLVIAFFIIHVFNKNNIYFFKYDKYIKYLFFFTIFATFSTSGIVMFAIIYIIYNLYQLFISKSVSKYSTKRFLYGIFILFLLIFLIYQNLDFLSKVLDERILGRDIASEDSDAPIQIFLLKFPEYLIFGSGLGNIHNFAYPYILPESMHYMKGQTFVAKSGYLRIISETGLIGFSLFILMTYTMYKKLSNIKKLFDKEKENVILSIQALLFLVLIAYLSRSYVFGEYILFLAIANAVYHSKTIRQNEALN